MAGLSPDQLEQLDKLSYDFAVNKNEAAGTEAFSLIDLDHDGFVNFEELSSAVSQMRGGSLTEEVTAQLRAKFAENDANSDGLLELSEFLNFFRGG
mmetsp:Transcript_22383/g.40442  ORF Transcript_22383/g.40442 Transcript_22383/m.40442 type:complete len:96 (-) Transcript_22383:29-316(-)